MNCQEVRELSSDYLDRRLKGSQVSMLEAHLNACSNCTGEMEALRTTVSLLGSLDEIRTAPDFLGRVQTKIERSRSSPRLWAWLFEPLRIKLPLEATALILVGIGALFLFSRSPELHRAPGAPAPMEKSYEFAQGKPQKEFSEGKPRAGSGNQMSTTTPKGAGKPEVQPSVSESVKELAQTPQPLASERDPQASRKTAGPSSLEGRIASQPSLSRPAPASGEARDERVASASKPEVHEVLVDDVNIYHARVEALLKKFGGKLLTQEGASGFESLLTVALPRSRQVEFLAALEEDAGARSKPESPQGALSRGAAGTGGGEAKRYDALSAARKARDQGLAPASTSSVQMDEPAVTMQIRILPKR